MIGSVRKGLTLFTCALKSSLIAIAVSLTGSDSHVKVLPKQV